MSPKGVPRVKSHLGFLFQRPGNGHPGRQQGGVNQEKRSAAQHFQLCLSNKQMKDWGEGGGSDG